MPEELNKHPDLAALEAEIIKILDDYDKTNRWMFTEEMSLLHYHAPRLIRSYLAMLQLTQLLRTQMNALSTYFDTSKSPFDGQDEMDWL